MRELRVISFKITYGHFLTLRNYGTQKRCYHISNQCEKLIVYHFINLNKTYYLK